MQVNCASMDFSQKFQKNNDPFSFYGPFYTRFLVRHFLLQEKLCHNAHIGRRQPEVNNWNLCFDYNKSRQPCYAQPIQAKLIPNCKDSFLHCSTWTSRLHLFSRLCPIFSRRLAPNNDTQ